MPSQKSSALAYILPTLLVITWAVLPLARGTDTLYLRDVFGVHLGLKGAHAAALESGFIPLLDPLRAGGQPLAGNPNVLPFYPDNLLYLVASVPWALNAHFWIHWLLAPFAMACLARVLELERRAAWAAGVIWATSGFFLSQLNLLNEVAVVTLAPALVAAFLRLAQRAGGSTAAAAGALLALLLLGGDPLLAAYAVVAAGLALALSLRERRATAEVQPRAPWRWLALALAGALAAAAPQLVEFARILPGSFRSAFGYSFEAATLSSWDPRQAIEWLLPFPFGRPDLLGEGAFRGHSVYGGFPPLYFSVFAGFLALALVLAAGRPRCLAARWAWLSIGLGIFFALGRFNPLGSWVFSLPGVRLPIKFWLWVGLGASILAGLGFERVFGERDEGARRRLSLALGALGGFAAAGWLLLGAKENAQLAATCGLLAGVASVLALACWLALRKQAAWPALVLAVHAVSQLVLLAPLIARDAVLPLTVPPPLLAALPPESVVAHGEAGNLFGPGSLGKGRFPEPGAHWLMRRAIWEFYPGSGTLWGRRFQCNTSPEGLDGVWSRLGEKAVQGLADRERVRLLAAFGVDRLLLVRPLAEDARAEVERLTEQPTFGQTLSVYRLPKALGEVQLLGTVRRVADESAVVRELTAEGFDPRLAAVVTEGPAAREAPPGTVELLDNRSEEVRARVASPGGGVLVLRRAYLSLWRAWIDGVEHQPERANLQLLALEVPAGEHEVRLATDRRPLLASLALSSLAWALLALVALRGRSVA